MLSYPERIEFVKLVEKHFVKAGWEIERFESKFCDFAVAKHELKLRIRCVDDKMMILRGTPYLLSELENGTRMLLTQNNLLCISILQRNFFGSDLRNLQARSIFAVSLEDISSILTLIHASWIVNKDLSEYQLSLLKRNSNYAVFVSDNFRKRGDVENALLWGQIAVDASYGFSKAHLHLFNLYIDLKMFKEAEGLGEVMVGYRPTDHRVMSCMVTLYSQNGDRVKAEKWRQRRAEDNVPPSSFEAILEKQKKQIESVYPTELRCETNEKRSVLHRIFRSPFK